MKRQIPNLFTLFNLISGCLSIIFLFSGEVMLASWMIGISAVLDFLDGLVARALNAASDLGKVLDSLADVVSFGVAPGMILFRMIQIYGDLPSVMAYIALLVPALSAVRLAVFSIDQRQQFHFIGVPTPMNALMLASIPLILGQYDPQSLVYGIFSDAWFLAGIAVVSSILLVAPVRIMALKFKSLAWRKNISAFILTAVFIILAIGLGYLAVPLTYVAYILISIIEQKIQQ